MTLTHAVTSGTFSLDGQTFDVDNNVWIVGDDRVRYAPELADRTGAPIWLHPADEPVWRLTHPDRRWDHDLVDGQEFAVGPVTLQVLHTPGHAPGAVCLYSPTLGCVFTGDTLFNGGPGATGRSFSSRPLFEESIRARLFVLPDDTVVHTGHGDDTKIGDEAPHLQEWIDRGH